MKTKNLTKLLGIAIALVTATGCLLLANSAWMLTPFWAWLQLNHLRSEMALVPPIANTTLVERIEGMFPSHVGGCASVYIYELRGSNNLSLSDVYDQFGSALPSLVQKTRSTAPIGEGYYWNKDISLQIISFASEGGILNFNKALSDAAMQTYKTLFVVGLNEPVYPEGHNNRCN